MSTAAGAIRFAGYAALFDIPDGIEDTIRAGAFARTLQRRDRPVPLYWQHNPDQQIGVVEKLHEDARGLAVIARIDNRQGRAASDLLAKRSTGLSFGYRAKGYRRTPNGRELSEIELIEVSLVTHPLQHGARVHLLA